MSPFIKDGDVITIAPVQPSNRNPHAPTPSSLPPEEAPELRNCGIGQVVAFVNPVNERLVVHRIIGRHESRFLIQGDNLAGAVADMIHRDDILGRVVRIERGRKRVWLGLGPERYAIAVLSRVGLLLPILLRAVALTRFLRKPPKEDD
jgi:hypothetical protein